MKKIIESIVPVILATFMFIGITSILIGIGFADSESFLPTLVLSGGGFITLALCYLFIKYVYNE